MTKPHKATPEQWAELEEWATKYEWSSCVVELRDRIAALEDDATEHSKSAHFCFEAIVQRIETLEAAANSSAALTGSNHPVKPDSSHAPAGGLVAKVTDAVVYGIEISDQRGAIDAILAVAEWFDAIGYGATASILRQELQRHG